MNILLMPVIFIIFAIIILIGSVKTIAKGGSVEYSESKMQSYCNTQYGKYFGSNADYYENSVLLVFLTYEGEKEYDCYSWIGDDLSYQMRKTFETYTGQVFANNIYENGYAYSLSRDLSDVIYEFTVMAPENAIGTTSTQKPSSAFVNESAYDISADKIDSALTEFTSKTGAPIVLVVDEAKDVFGKNAFQLTVSFVLVGIFLLVGVLTIVSGVKKYKAEKAKAKAKKNSSSYNKYGPDNYSDNDPNSLF